MLDVKITEALLQIDLKIIELERLREVAVVEANFDEYKKNCGSISVEEFERLRIAENMACARLDRINMDLESIKLEKTILLQRSKSATFERIIIGAGIAGTAVFLEVSALAVDKAPSVTFPEIIVLNDPADHHQWRKDGVMLMGQPAAIQTPQAFSHHSEDFAADEVSIRNPYNYVMSNHFDHALVNTQATAGMKILHLAADDIESKDSYVGDVAWEHDTFPHRICVQMQGIKYYLYTHHIDLCTGPGPTRKLAAGQIPPALEQKLVHDGIMLYGQNWGDKKLHGNVIFYGGGARNAAMILDILNGYHPEVTSFTYIARNGEDFDDNALFNRMFNDLDSDRRCSMALAELMTVEQLGDKQLKLTFGPPQKSRKIKSLGVITVPILCDQLVVSVGQDVYPVIRKLTGFVPCLLENTFTGIDDEVEVIPLGTHTPDRSIVAWGAAGAMGTGLDDTSKFNEAVINHAQTLPRESRATVGVFRSNWTIQMMAKKLQQGAPGTMKTKDIHACDLPDINLATRSDLYEIIRLNMKGLSPREHLRMADRIIEIRSTQPVGLPDLSILNAEIPRPVVIALMQEYFPLEVIPEMMPPVKARLPAVIGSSRPATFFGGASSVVNHDSFADAMTLLGTTVGDDMFLPEIKEELSIDNADEDIHTGLVVQVAT